MRGMKNSKFSRAIAKAAEEEGRRTAKLAAQRNHAVELARIVSIAAKNAEAEYRRDNPGAVEVRVSRDIFAYVKRPRGFANYAQQMVDMFLAQRETLTWNNARLSEQVGLNFGFDAPVSLMTEQLTASQKRKVETTLGQWEMSLDLRKHNTISKIKLALRAHFSAERSKKKFTGTVHFTDNEVIVNGKRRVIQKTDKGPRIHVGKQWVNVDRLKALLVEA